MSIALTAPIAGPTALTAKADGIGVRVYEQTAVIIIGLYDASGKRIGEQRMEVNATSVPSWSTFVASCPSATSFRNQVEAFAAANMSGLAGEVA